MANGSGRDHIPGVPPFFTFLVIAKIVIAVVVLALAAYGATFDDWFGGNGYAIFCAIAIFITEGYYLASTILTPQLFNCWAYLILSCLQFIWWLSCWANLAAWAAAYNISYNSLNFSELLDAALDCHYDNDLNVICPSEKDRKRHRDVMAAAAGIGALEWILVIISLVIFAIALHRHRTSGAPYAAGGAWRTTSQNPTATPGGVEAQHSGKEAMPSPTMQAPQQSYQMYPPTQPQQQPVQNVYQQNGGYQG